MFRMGNSPPSLTEYTWVSALHDWSERHSEGGDEMKWEQVAVCRFTRTGVPPRRSVKVQPIERYGAGPHHRRSQWVCHCIPKKKKLDTSFFTVLFSTILAVVNGRCARDKKNKQCAFNDIPDSNLFLVKGQAAITLYSDWTAVTLPTLLNRHRPTRAPSNELLHDN